MKGKVKWFDSKKGYGFIERENKQGDLFFHHSEVQSEENLQQNDEVEFEIAPGREGKEKAVKIRRVVK